MNTCTVLTNKLLATCNKGFLVLSKPGQLYSPILSRFRNHQVWSCCSLSKICFAFSSLCAEFCVHERTQAPCISAKTSSWSLSLKTSLLCSFSSWRDTQGHPLSYKHILQLTFAELHNDDKHVSFCKLLQQNLVVSHQTRYSLILLFQDLIQILGQLVDHRLLSRQVVNILCISSGRPRTLNPLRYSILQSHVFCVR